VSIPRACRWALRTVELDRHASSNVVVSQGIEPGELVVTAACTPLRRGQKVRLLGGSS